MLGEFSPETAAFFLQFMRILFLLGFLLYVAFAFIAVRQIDIMRKTVVTPFSPFIQVVGYLHFLLSASALFFAFLYL